MTIDSPTQFSAKIGKIRAIVRAKYTYGKYVKGNAIVSLTPRNTYYHWSAKQKDDSAVIKTIKVDGKGTAEFDIDDDLKPKFEQYRTSFDYELKAVVIEELTGERYKSWDCTEEKTQMWYAFFHVIHRVEPECN